MHSEGPGNESGPEPGNRVEIPAVLDLAGNDVLSGDAGHGFSDIGQQEVMQGPVPTAHAGAHGFLLDVLGEGSALLGVLGVEPGGDVAHGVPGALIAFEEHLFGVFAEEPACPSMHGLLFRAAEL